VPAADHFRMNTHPFKQVDVFADQPLSGNPVAVVLNAAGLSTADMQSLARWTHLSETTFVLPGTQADVPAIADPVNRSHRPTAGDAGRPLRSDLGARSMVKHLTHFSG
jgi:Phenazine biosynthesis-like protein